MLEDAIYKKVTGDAKVSDADVQVVLRRAPVAYYTQPETRVVRHILVKNKALADKLVRAAEGRRRLRGAREEVLAGPGLEGRRADTLTTPAARPCRSSTRPRST